MSRRILAVLATVGLLIGLVGTGAAQAAAPPQDHVYRANCDYGSYAIWYDTSSHRGWISVDQVLMRATVLIPVNDVEVLITHMPAGGVIHDNARGHLNMGENAEQVWSWPQFFVKSNSAASAVRVELSFTRYADNLTGRCYAWLWGG